MATKQLPAHHKCLATHRRLDTALEGLGMQGDRSGAGPVDISPTNVKLSGERFNGYLQNYKSSMHLVYI